MLSNFANGPILLPVTRRQWGQARGLPGIGHWAGKRHSHCFTAGRLSIPARFQPLRLPAPSKQCHFWSHFGQGGGLSAGPHGSAPLTLLKITAKYVLFLSPCQQWDYFRSNERVSRQCRQSRGDTCALAGIPSQLLPAARSSSGILMSKAQPRAGCNPPLGLAQGTEACS